MLGSEGPFGIFLVRGYLTVAGRRGSTVTLLDRSRIQFIGRNTTLRTAAASRPDRDQAQLIQAVHGRGGPQQLAMTKDDAIGGEHLDRSYSARAEKPLKSGQLALAFEHQPDNGTLRRDIVRP